MWQSVPNQWNTNENVVWDRFWPRVAPRSAPGRLPDETVKPARRLFGRRMPAGHDLGAISGSKSIKLDAKNDAKIDVEQLLKNDANIFQNDRNMDSKSIEQN